MKKNNLVIINNEKIFKENNNYYCDNLDLKVVPEGLSQYHEINYIVRTSKKKGGQKLNLKNINAASNIFKFILFILKTIKQSNTNYLLISITPYTFAAFVVLFLVRKRTVVYLMSNGHEEYKYILGKWAVWIYHLMYVLVTSNSKVIVCHDRLYKKNKSHIIHPSQLDDSWLTNHKKPFVDKIKFLYVGRLNPEKGIYDFLKMFEQSDLNAELTIVGDKKNLGISKKNINMLGYIPETQLLINAYDNCNIMILPSYTEAHPYVVDESLSRRRPVIIFEDIAYVKKEKKGIFITKRNIHSLTETTKYIMKNYNLIQKEMEKNILPTKKVMLKNISNIILS
jgi:glycosyltransferase involved in cell wall biosynthesis